MKKVIALMLAMIMVLGLCSMASATAPADRVQINNMMVDASLVEAETFTPVVYNVVEETEKDLYLENVSDVAQFAATSTVNYPPIAKIALGSNSSINATDDGTTVQYLLHVPNGSTSGTQDFVFTASDSTTYSNLVVTANGQNIALTANQNTTIAMTLENGSTSFSASWTNKSGVACTTQCTLTIDTSTSVSLYGVRNDDGEMDYDDSVIVTYPAVNKATVSEKTVGGVTRYTCAITLAENTSNASVDVKFKLASTGATATLGGTAASGSSVDSATATKTVTFEDIDLSSAKDLVITNKTSNGNISRTYLVSAAAAGSTVTVHIALRTFLADEYLENRTNWYTGYGTSSVSGTEKTRLLGVASYLRSANSPTTSTETKNYNGNGPLSQEASGRMIFSEESYVTLNVPASYTVRDALNSFTSNTTYFPNGFVITGSDSYIEAMGQTSSNVMGEFDCGSASGWMYTARTSRTDVTSALPNAGANTWPVSNGMYIDWYYTAAYGMDFGYSMFG